MSHPDDLLARRTATPEGNAVFRVGTLKGVNLDSVDVELDGELLESIRTLRTGSTLGIADIDEPVWLLQTQTTVVCLGRPLT